MTRPVRLRLSRAKGFNLQAHSLATNGLPAVNVARPSKWGNPFIIGKHGTRAECVKAFRVFIDPPAVKMDGPKRVKRDISVLRGNNLACWCPLPNHGEPDVCHAAILLDLANR